jgi:DNA-binding NarL/FixJ family response regulator
MSSLVARKVVGFFRTGHLRAPETSETVPLTRRERDVLRSLAEGLSYKAIAEQSRMSVNTVRYHIRNLYEKLEVHSQSEAVAKGLRQGLI